MWRVGEKKGRGRGAAGKLTDEGAKERRMPGHSHSSKESGFVDEYVQRTYYCNARILTRIYSQSLDKKPIHILTNVAKYVMEFYLSTNSASVAGYARVGRSRGE